MMDLWDIFASGGESMSLEAMLLHLLLAFVLAQVVAWVYMWTHRGISYSRSQVQSLILLSLVVAIVMMAIGNNLARGFGLFGALALIRFRTPIKDIRDTVFLFISVAIGIAVGSENLVAAVAGTAVITVLAAYMHLTDFGARIGHDAVLRFHVSDDGDDDRPLRTILRRYCQRFSLMHLREGNEGEPVELTYQVKLLEPGYSRGLVAEMQELETVHGITLHLQGEDVEI